MYQKKCYFILSIVAIIFCNSSHAMKRPRNNLLDELTQNAGDNKELIGLTQNAEGNIVVNTCTHFLCENCPQRMNKRGKFVYGNTIIDADCNIVINKAKEFLCEACPLKKIQPEPVAEIIGWRVCSIIENVDFKIVEKDGKYGRIIQNHICIKDHCRYSTTRKDRMQVHSDMHKEKVSFVCPECDYRVKKETVFKRHRASHLPKKRAEDSYDGSSDGE